MTEQELEAEVDRMLALEMEKRRAALRQEIRERVNREEFRKRMDRINARHPSEDAYTLEEQQARDAALAASREAMVEKLAKNDARYAEQEKAREQHRREYFAGKR